MVVNRLGSKAHTGRFRALSFTIRSLHFRSRSCDQFPHRTYNTVFRFSVLPVSPSQLCCSLLFGISAKLNSEAQVQDYTVTFLFEV